MAVFADSAHTKSEPMVQRAKSPPRLVAVIVLYKCSIRESSTVGTMLMQLPYSQDAVNVLVYDNSPKADPTALPMGWQYISNTSNPGLPAAYNTGMAQALKSGAPWLLLLDQDSQLPPDFLIHLLDDLQRAESNPAIAAIVPHVIANRKHLSPVYAGFGFDRPLSFGRTVTSRWLAAINSAATIRVSFLEPIGGFSLRFQLDYLDHWLFRAIYDAGRLVLVSDTQIEHSLSVANFNEGLSLNRYRNVLAAEAAFTNCFLPFHWRPLLALRFTARALKHLALTNDKHFSRLMISAACTQTLAIFRHPIARSSAAAPLGRRTESPTSNSTKTDYSIRSIDPSRSIATLMSLGPVAPIRQRISVCMATWNGAKFIARQLASILSQLGPGDELVISDDSSTDDTVAIIQSFHDPRIRLFTGQLFHSPTYNFEYALKQAQGDLIFLSDQDDEWVEGWVEAALRELLEVSLVVCDACIIDAEGKVRPASEAKIYNGRRRPGVLNNLYRNGYVGCCCAFRRSVLEAALPFPDKLPWHDWWIGLIADSLFTTRFINRQFIRYRRHGNNASPTGEKSRFSLARRLRMRWQISLALGLRIWSHARNRRLVAPVD